MKYPRNPHQRQGDHRNARVNEELVGTWLGDFKVANLDSTDRLDYWVPGIFLDVKEKRQPIGPRWPLPAGTVEANAFILDELSVRKAMSHHPHAYFVLHDCPHDRWFLARADEVVCADRVRINRVGSTNVAKGKWVLDLTQFRQLLSPAEQLLQTILADQIQMPWKQSACLVPTPEDRGLTS